MKAQLMTISVLVLFILMLAELIIFVTLTNGYNGLSQAYSQQKGVSNYASFVYSSSHQFAAASLNASIFALASYENMTNYHYSPVLSAVRFTDLITNSSAYLAQIMMNGTVPNEQGYLTYNLFGTGNNYVAPQFFKNYYLDLFYYNASIEGSPPLGVSNVIISQTRPQIYQTSSYSISVRYTEYLKFNQSGTIYAYTFPINATVPLNNTPDLLYAQEGIIRYIHFANISGLITPIGEAQAINGTTNLFSYGTILNYGSNTICPSSNSLISSQIIFTVDSANSINCNGSSFGGIISYSSPSASAPDYVPYLNFQKSSGYIQNSLITGDSALLYGPSLSVLNISGLRKAIMDGYYFASPYAPSYLDRASGNLANSSIYGIFTFSGYNRRVAYLDSNSYITGNLLNAANMTNFEWVYPMENSSFSPIAEFDGSSSNYGFYNISLSNGNIVVWNGNKKYTSYFKVPMYKWSFIGFSLNRTSIRVFYNGNSQLFTSLTNPQSSGSDWIIGAQLGNTDYYTKMALANVQLYKSILTTQQAYSEYQDGIGGVPIASSNSIAIWLQLDNNTADSSGNGYYSYVIGSTDHIVNGHNGTAHSVSYGYPVNYNRDSALIVPSAQPTFPIPGILGCSNYQECMNTTMPHLYLSDMPLEYGPSQSAVFNPSVSSMIITQQLNATPVARTGSFTFSAWVYGSPYVTNGETIANSSSNNNNAGFDLLFSELSNGNQNYMLSIAPCCNHVLKWPNGINGFSNLPTKTWEFVTAEYNSTTGTASVYLNSHVIASGNAGKGLNPGQLLPIYIGSNSVSGGTQYSFNGSMIDIQLYDSNLSSSQVTELYSKGMGGAPLVGNSLVAWWPLDGNANDYSGNGNNGTAYNLTYAPITGYSGSGSSSPTAVSDAWQAFGFGAAPEQSVFWNVTEWIPQSTSTDPVSYSSVTGSPLLPQGVNVYTSDLSGWYGIPTSRNNPNGLPGFTGWAYHSSAVANNQILLMNAVPFPVPFNGLNDYATCGAPDAGYTATANMTLTGTYTINTYVNGAVQAFYRPQGSSIWNPVLPSGAWSANNGQAYSGSFTLTPGAYQFAVDYESTCGYGTSAFSMSYG